MLEVASPDARLNQTPKILIIEDEEATRYALSWALRKGGYQVIEAATAKEGLMFLIQNPDLVILDVHLPDMSGFEVCQIIKMDARTSSIPVLHMSASYSKSADKIQGLELGADAYLVHPVEDPELLATVKALLRIRKSEFLANHAAQLWESTFNAIRDGVCVLDDDGVIQKANSAFFDVFPEIELLDTISDYIPAFVEIEDWSGRKEIAIETRWFEVEANTLDVSGRVCTFRDVTDKRLAEKELLLAKKNAEAANLSKSRFLANMSHEIRTPLGAIVGFTELLRETRTAPEEAEEYLETIMRNGQNLSMLIDDILDLSKVEAEKMVFHRGPTNIAELVAEVESSLGLQARSKGLGLTHSIASDVPSVILTDSFRLRQILVNIVGNALKFTHAGAVSVDVRRSGEFLEILVQDTGRGVSEIDVDKLFQPFSQGDSTTTREYGGTGLGLILSKQIAIGLGGDVSLESSKPGEGSLFSIRIALEVKEVEKKTAVRKTVATGTLSGLRILVVDDSADNRLLIHRILSKHGAEVEVAENGEEALRRAAPFDMVILDIQMPVLDGYETTVRLRERGFTAPIIALTAHAMSTERERCLKLGCNDYLTKPIDSALLIEALARFRS